MVQIITLGRVNQVMVIVVIWKTDLGLPDHDQE